MSVFSEFSPAVIGVGCGGGGGIGSGVAIGAAVGVVTSGVFFVIVSPRRGIVGAEGNAMCSGVERSFTFMMPSAGFWVTQPWITAHLKKARMVERPLLMVDIGVLSVWRARV